MKKQSLFLLLFPIAAASCGGADTAGSKTKAFIVGTYATGYTNEFNTTYDTVVVAPMAGSAEDMFTVINRTTIIYKEPDATTPPQKSNRRQWDGRFHADTHVLDGPDPGTSLSFDPDKGEAYIGNVTYKKLH